jgi:hypothetical protein
VCSNLKVITPSSKEIIAGFSSLEHKLVQTYYDPKLWKTDAKPETVYDIFRAYKIKQCEKEKTELMQNVHEANWIRQVLTKPLTIKPDFTAEHAVSTKLRKYFTASEPNWGPKARATGEKQ